MPERDTKSDLADDRPGRRAEIRHQFTDGSLLWVYHVTLRDAEGHEALRVRMDVDGELFVSIQPGRPGE